MENACLRLGLNWAIDSLFLALVILKQSIDRLHGFEQKLPQFDQRHRVRRDGHPAQPRQQVSREGKHCDRR